MKYFQKITLCLAAIVVMALGNKAAASITIDPSAPDQLDAASHTGHSIMVIDSLADGGNDDGGSILFTNADNASIEIKSNGIVKVGTTGLGISGTDVAKTGTGSVVVDSGGVLEITAATADCIAGDVEVESGGILQVDDDIPASGGPFATGADLTVHSGAIIRLGAGVTWSKDVTVS